MIVGRLDGDLKALVNDVVSDVAGGARAAVRGASEQLQADLRGQVRAAGLGVGLEKAWRLELYPKTGRRTLRPAGLVYSKATRLHDAFDAGETVVAGKGKWLAIPLPAAIQAGLHKRDQRPDTQRAGPLPAKWSSVDEARHLFGELAFVPLDGGKRALLVARGRSSGGILHARARGPAQDTPLFLLVRRVRGRKLLDIDAALKAAEARLARSLSNILPNRS